MPTDLNGLRKKVYCSAKLDFFKRRLTFPQNSAKIVQEYFGEGEWDHVNKKDWGAIGFSTLSFVIALVALKPKEWANNIASWKTILFCLAMITSIVVFAFWVSNKIFNAGHITVFNSRTNIKFKNLMSKELDTTKSITMVGIACDELSKQTYDFWKRFLADHDGRLRVIFLDPNGVQIGLREKMVCGQTKGEFADSVKYNIRILFEKIDRLKDSEKNDEIRAAIKINDFIPSVNCIVTDKYVFLHHYGSPTRGIDMPVFVIHKGRNKTNNQAYDFYRSMLNSLWKKSFDCKEEDYHGIQASRR